MSAKCYGSAALALFALVACDSIKSGPADVMVLAYDSSAGRYVPRKVRLNTVTDVETMTGPVAKILGGADFEVRNDRLHIGSRGSTVHLDLLEQSDGTLVPADFDSLNIATTYYNFERASNLFTTLAGPSDPTLPTPDVFYFAHFVQDGKTVTDNAAFVPVLPGFLVLPYDVLQRIPLSINTGVVGHEYSHAIMNLRMCGDSLGTCHGSERWAPANSTAPTPGYNLLRAIDEGIADVFGTALTCDEDLTGCDAQFIGRSLWPRAESERRIDVPHCMSAALRTCMQQYDAETFLFGTRTGTGPCGQGGNNYYVGSVLASSLWRAATYPQIVNALGAGPALGAVLRTVFHAQRAAATLPGFDTLITQAGFDQTRFRLESAGGDVGVLDALIANTENPLLKEALCAAFVDRFAVALSDMPSCPTFTQTFTRECAR